MEQRPRMTELTQKAEATKQRILDAAFKLIVERGYERTTMRDIAAVADCSPGLAYRYFASKEDIVLELYRRLALELKSLVTELPHATIADRFQQTMQTLLELMTPYRDALGSLFGTALNPRSKAGVFGRDASDVRHNTRNVYISVVSGAKDAPRVGQTRELATVLYGIHLALVLFWLQDLSDNSKKTYEFLAFLHDMLALVRPLLGLPPVAKNLARLVRIIGPMLGDEDI